MVALMEADCPLSMGGPSVVELPLPEATRIAEMANLLEYLYLPILDRVRITRLPFGGLAREASFR